MSNYNYSYRLSDGGDHHDSGAIEPADDPLPHTDDPLPSTPVTSWWDDYWYVIPIGLGGIALVIWLMSQKKPKRKRKS